MPDLREWLRGGCHCGAVMFSFRATNDYFTECNCTYCVRKAARHYRVLNSDFEAESTSSVSTVYRFGTRLAAHVFCRCCGVHVYCHPRSAPGEVNVNLNCLHERHFAWLSTLTSRFYNGRDLK
ncbi:GFA family protein [Pseudomonas asiatica]